MPQNSTLRKRKGQEGLQDVRKFPKNRKSNKNFSSYVKRLSNKYGKNSMNKQISQNSTLGKRKGQEGLQLVRKECCSQKGASFKQ